MGALNDETGVSESGVEPDAAASLPVGNEVPPEVRHDLRNKFAAVRNAVFYIERSLKKSGSLDKDPKVGRFLRLVCEQLDAADALVGGSKEKSST